MSWGFSFRFFLVLFTSLALVTGVDLGVAAIFGNQTLTPMLSVISLGALACFFTFRQVLLAVPLFVCLSYFMVMDFSPFPMVRSFSVLVGGIVACWGATQRCRLSERLGELESLMQSLPSPWILSDDLGLITRHSSGLQDLSGSARDLVGTSLFSFFNLASNSDFISKYIDAFAKRLLPSETNLSLAGTSKIYWVSYVFLRHKNGLRLLSILKEKNSK